MTHTHLKISRSKDEPGKARLIWQEKHHRGVSAAIMKEQGIQRQLDSQHSKFQVMSEENLKQKPSCTSHHSNSFSPSLTRVFSTSKPNPKPKNLSVVQVGPASEAETQLVRGAVRGASAASGSAGGDGATRIRLGIARKFGEMSMGISSWTDKLQGLC